MRDISNCEVHGCGELSFCSSPSAIQRRNPCSGPQLNTLHNWPDKDAMSISRLKGNSKRISFNSLSSLRALNKNIGAASLRLPYVCEVG